MTEDEKKALEMLHGLMTAQPNLFNGVGPNAAVGKSLAEFMLSFIKTYAAGKVAPRD